MTHRSTSAAPPVVRRRRRGAPFRAGGTTAARELLWLEDHETALAQRSRHRRAVPPRLTRGVDLCELEFAYPGSDGERTLAGLDLTLPAGRSIALVGENGAGKTTLVKLLCGMCHPSRGRVLIDGVDLAEMDPGAWRERVSGAFQDFVHFHLPLRESVGVGNRFTGGRELSGGEWQRLALARGLMRAAPLLVVLDEPTASLDAPTETALFDRSAAAARDLGAAHGTITLLVSHRFSTVRAADLIVVLDHGGVLEVGSHGGLMAAGGTYAELFTMQARAYR